MAKKKKRPQGHYCKICGGYKANEKFSGKGHAVHICKSCSHLSAAEKAEAQTLNRLMGLPLRHLNQGDKKWLENRVHDSRPEVAELAKKVYRECFPYAERNALKKQLVISELDFEIHTEVYQDYGDWETVNQEFQIVRKERKITFLDSDRGGLKQDWRVWVKYSNGIEQEISCYDGELTDKPEEMYFCLLEYFESVE